MPYTVPKFPLVCNIWNLAVNETSIWPFGRLADQVLIPCQKAAPLFLRQLTFQPVDFETSLKGPVIIRFPKGTNVNDGAYNTSVSARGFGDVVELPPGSGCTYGVYEKITVGQGFPNEHIRCLCVRLRYHVGDE